MGYTSVLITGASGKLGKTLTSLDWKGKKIWAPTRNEMDITCETSVRSYFETHKFDSIIHCAAFTDMKRCESEPSLAKAVNIEGTARLVRLLTAHCPSARILYISTDYVYPSLQGPYKEGDAVKPFNAYALTKFGGECAVQTTTNHCIVRTSFFNPNHIPFDSAPTDAFCSKISFDEGAKAIQFILDSNFLGVINVGRDRISLYDLLRAYRADMRPVTLAEINRTAPILRAPDSSLDITLWKQVRSRA